MRYDLWRGSPAAAKAPTDRWPVLTPRTLTLLFLTLTPAVLRGQVRLDTLPVHIPRLAPSAFPALPNAVRTALEGRHCLIPQSYSRSPHNVGQGSFRTAGKVDWYALCSRAGMSYVFIFWGGRAEAPDSILPSSDSAYIQYLDDAMTYSRYVTSRRLQNDTSGRKSLFVLLNAFDGKAGSYYKWSPQGWVQDDTMDDPD